jgi:hypothetical protein
VRVSLSALSRDTYLRGWPCPWRGSWYRTSRLPGVYTVGGR